MVNRNSLDTHSFHDGREIGRKMRPLTSEERNDLDTLTTAYHDLLLADTTVPYDEKAKAIVKAELLVARIQRGGMIPDGI